MVGKLQMIYPLYPIQMTKEFKFNLSALGQKLIASGGGGKIFDLENGTVLKYFHAAEDSSFESHLEYLKALPDSFVKPIDIYSSGNKIVGYTMKYVDLKQYNLFNTLFNKLFCTKNNLDTNFKIKLLKNIKKDLDYLHTKGIVVGDLNQYNIFYNFKGEYLFVDTDAFQTLDRKHSNVLIEEIQDYLNPVGRSSDMWAYTILSFWALCYVHPFKWVLKNNTESLETRVRLNKSYLNTPGIIIPALYVPPSRENEQQFSEIFKGRRFFIDFDGTVLPSPIQITQQIQSIALNCIKMFENVKDFEGNKDYVVIQQDDLFKLIKCNQKGFYAPVIENTDYFVINEKGAVTFIGENTVGSHYVSKGLYYYYNNGLIAVSEFDQLFSFNLDLQMAGISHQISPTFSKSFSKGDALIQNFGAMKYLVIPKNGQAMLHEIPFSTKNAYMVNDYACIEYTEKNKTLFMIYNIITKKKISIDYFAYFAEKDGILFIPDDGQINMIKDGISIGVLPLNICSKSTKLHSTTSGILMLENQILYLLNSK